jgi:acetyl esterase
VTDVHPLLQAARGAGGPKLSELTVAEARALEEEEEALGQSEPPEPVPVVADMTLGTGTTARVYSHGAAGPAPCLVYFFGGGWVLGSLDSIDPTCRRLANAAGCTVVSVGYPRAPEHPFPAAVEACYAAVRWIARHAGELGIDADRLAVGGTSAGGNLAAVVALLARERGGPSLTAQVLVYPVVDHLPATESMRAMAVDDDFFDARSMAWCWGHYVSDPADAESPLAAPMRADDVSGLPPAVVITAEHDPLRDEAELYARRLEAAGVRVDLARYDGMVHGFFSMSELEASQAAVALAAAALRREWA